MSLLAFVSCYAVFCYAVHRVCLPEGLGGREFGDFASHHFIHSGQDEPMARQHLPESGAQGLEDQDWARGGVPEPRPIKREQSCPHHERDRGLLHPLLARQRQRLLGGRLLVLDLQSKTNGDKQSTTTQPNTHDHTTKHISTHIHTYTHTTAHKKSH